MLQKRLTLKQEVFIYAIIIGFIPLFLTIWILNVSVNQVFEDRIKQEAMDLATQTSQNINIINTFADILPNREILQSTANELRERNGAHVVFLDIYGTALINPYPPNYELQVIGNEKGRALKGVSYTTLVEGHTGRVIRAFAPIKTIEGRQKGVVVVAFLEPDIELIISQVYKSISTALPLTILLIITLSSILAHSIKSRIFGMEPIEIATVLSERESLLQSVAEAIIATNEKLEITVVNEAAISLFINKKEKDIIGQKIQNFLLEPALTNVMESKQPEFNKQILLNGEIFLANSCPLLIDDKAMGIVVTLRNRTEITRLAGELTGVQRIVEALRAKTHEFSNKLHVIYGLIQRGHYHDAERFIDRVAEEKNSFNSIINNIQLPAIKALLLGKTSEAEEKKICFTVDSQSFLFCLPEYFDENSLVVVLGNLIDNAFEALEGHPENSSVFLSLKQDEEKIEISIEDNGYGILKDIHSKIFEPGFTTKIKGSGFGLYNIKTQVSLAQGTIAFTSNSSGTTFLVTIPFSIYKKVW